MNDRTANHVVQHWVPRNDLEAFGMRVVHAFNERDLAVGLALSHPDIVAVPSRATGGARGFRGHAGLREWGRAMEQRASWYEILVSSMQRVERRAEDRRARHREVDDAADAVSRAPVDHRQEERRRTRASKLAIFGDLCLNGEPLSPWASVLIIQDGLIIRQRSYLSNRELLDEIGVFTDPFQPRTDAG